MEAEELIRLYEGTSAGAASTVATRVLAVRQFRTWCERNGEQFPPLSEQTLWQYVAYRKTVLRQKDSTTTTNVNGLRNFYKWMIGQGIIPPQEVPLAKYSSINLAPIAKETLTVDELRRMWRVAPSPRHRVIVGLLGIVGLRVDEVVNLDIGDIRTEDGYMSLNIRKASGARLNIRALVPNALASEIRTVVGERRSGPVLFRESDGQPENRRTASNAVALCGRRAGLPFKVTPMTLSYTLRAIGIDKGFSYLGLLSALGEVYPPKAKRWHALHVAPPGQHAAIRLGRLVFTENQQSLDYLNQAEIVLGETDLPPAIAVMAAGAAFEAHLRNMCRAASIPIKKSDEDAKISTYTAGLREHRAITNDEIQQIQLIGIARNDAAHGWFDKVDQKRAQDVIRLCRGIIEAHPT